jgi:alginate O-acetyltransferase complex protein AlgI
LGLGKKVIIADTVGLIADQIFNFNPARLDTPMAWFGIICYAFQLYFDFSGYSDMAIGMGKMFGFNLPENFNRPYLSKSLTEFWQRWHMSLSRFFKDYVYIPLGGSRCSKPRQYFNLWVVFLLCGFWHGANWNCVLWGIYNGVILVLDRLFLLKRLAKLPAFLSAMFTFVIFLIGLAIFRTPGLASAGHYLQAMFTPRLSITNLLWGQINLNTEVLLVLLIAVIVSFVILKEKSKIVVKWEEATVFKGYCGLVLLGYSIIVMSSGSFSPFIYFHF